MRKLLLIGIVVLVLMPASFYAGYYYGRSERPLPMLNTSFSPQGRITVLIVGQDQGINMPKGEGRSDTIIVGSLDLASNKGFILSIPRDTRVYIPAAGREDKINSAIVISGIEATKEAISNLLGIPIDYYVKVKVEGFQKIVDALGGIDIYVDRDMHYKDDTQHLYINLKKGYQHLNGYQAMGFVRFRHESLGDLARIKRQQRFILALLNKIRSPAVLPRLPFLLKEIYKNVETNFTLSDLLFLAKKYGKELPIVETAVLPGRPMTINGVSYYEPDTDDLQFIAQRILNPSVQESGPTVEVLNGGGIPGAASKAAQKLSELGFSVVYIGNAESFSHNKTVIMVHTDGLNESTRVLKETLGCGEIKKNGNPGKADFTVILGKDFTP
ncbi:LCP family protein [bacterium]|nr:LCP family protein [bacterium]